MSTIPTAEQSRIAHFLALNRNAQAGAIRRMAMAGNSLATIAAATRLSLEQIERVLAEDRGQ
jgi:hypothetical protein